MNLLRVHALSALLLAACAGPSGLSGTPVSGDSTESATANSETAADTETAETAATPETMPDTDPPEGTVPSLRLPTRIVPTRYALELTIDPEQEHFTGAVTIELQVVRPTREIWLNGTDIDVLSARLTVAGGERTLQPIAENAADFMGFTTENQLAVGPARLYIEYRAKLGTMHHGGIFRDLEKNQDSNNNDWYVYSHFEPLDARQAVPCFDEPRFKVPWQITLETKDSDLAFTNTPEVNTRPSATAAGFTRHEFAESKPLPSYLVALMVGPFDVVDLGRIGSGHTPARVITPRGRGADAAFAAKTIPEVLAWLERYFDSGYPYAKLDSVAVPGMSGAMEHPGLITYGADILLTRDGRRGSRFESYHVMVVAHELAHQWFGNLVTLAWWNDLWLNESFATWMASKVRHSWRSEWHSDIEDLAQLDWTKRVDSEPTAGRLRRVISDNTDIENTFDAISYGKGGAVLGMFEQWIGEQTFRRGVHVYLREHAWGTTTAEDFLAALAKVSRPEVADAFQSFLEQPGIPEVSVQLACEPNAPASLFLRQRRFAETSANTPAPGSASTSAPGPVSTAAGQSWRIPVCVRYGRDALVHQQCTLMTGELATLVLDQMNECPKHLVANAHGAGYYRVAYTKPMRDELLGDGFEGMSTLERLATMNDIRALAEQGAVSAAEVLALVATLTRRQDTYVLAQTGALLRSVHTEWLPPSLRKRYARFVQAHFGKHARTMGWQVDDDEPAMLGMRADLLQMVAVDGEDRTLRRRARALAVAWLDEPQTLEREMLAAVLIAGLADADEALYRRFEDKLETLDWSLRIAVLVALAHTDELPRLQRHWQALLDNTQDWRYNWLFLQVSMTRARTRDAAYRFTIDNIDALAARLPKQWRHQLVLLFGGVCDRARGQEIAALLANKVGDMENGALVLKATLETIEQCAATRAVQAPEIEAFMRAWRPGG